MTCFDGRAAASAAATVCAKFSSTTMARAPLSASWCSSSGIVYIGLTFTATMPGAQDAEQHDGRLQRVRHHDRDAIAALARRAALAGTPRTRATSALDLGERQRRAEIRERGLRGEPREARFEQRDERRIAIGIDLGRARPASTRASQGLAGIARRQQRAEHAPDVGEHDLLTRGVRMDAVGLHELAMQRDVRRAGTRSAPRRNAPRARDKRRRALACTSCP